MYKKTVIITHKNCPDGFTAAWVAWTIFKDNADYIGESPGQKDFSYLHKLKNKNVYIFDIYVPQELINKIKQIANNLVVIDHHPNSENLKGIHYNEKHSAGYLCWQYFYPKKDIPAFIKLISDNDTGTWKIKYSEELSLYVKYNVKPVLLKYNFKQLSKLTNDSDLKLAIKIGINYKEYELNLIESVAKYAKQKKYKNYSVLIVESCIPSLGGKIATYLSNKPGIKFGAVYRTLAPNKYLITTRSNNKSVDLNKIANKYGGGGHKGAASFVVKKLDIFN